VLKWSGRPSLAVTVRNYSPESDRLQRDLRRASLLLMPSRAEGFGLVGLEAIAAGTPALVSDRSGLGQLLREVLPRADADRLVVPVENDAHDVTVWGDAIHYVLGDRQAAFVRADSIRRTMRERRTWSTAVVRLLTALQVTESSMASS
jgi:glycosyltransferase involved in cell wall biosynthesis